MDLTERYLGAVRWNLPADKADDIVAELADLITARVEDREEALNRPLTRSELSALLKDFGHPLAVAGRYHGQRALIGADVFPFYWFVLRVWLAVVAVIEAIEIGGRLVLGSQPAAQALSQGFHGGAQTLLLHAAIVTLIFAVVERTGWLATYLERWKPEDLPALRLPARPRRRWEPVFEFAFGAAFLLWWSGAFAFPLIPQDARATITPAPVWTLLFWPVVALVSARMLQALVALLRPGAKPLRAALSIGCAAGTLAIVAVLHGVGRLVTVTSSTLDAAGVEALQQGLDKGLGIALIVVPVVAIWQCAVELWRLAREGR
jgi:hypothetical protein